MEPDIPEEYRNTIVCGDARALAERLPAESVDLVLTDPPFGIGFKYNGYKDDPRTYRKLLRWTIKEAERVIKPGGLCFVYVAQPQLRNVWLLFPDNSRIFAACKNFVQMRPTPVQYAYDPVVFWQKDGRLLPAYQGRDYHIGNTANTTNRKADEAGWHECPRPLSTIAYIIENFCPPGGVVCDFYMGSGTTAVAAKMYSRSFVGFEIRPEHAARARARVEHTQSMSPVLLGIQEELAL